MSVTMPTLEECKIQNPDKLTTQPLLKDIIHDLGIPKESKSMFFGWAIGDTNNKHQFLNLNYSPLTSKFTDIFTQDVLKSKKFEFNDYKKAVKFVESLPFPARVVALIGWETQSKNGMEISPDAQIDKNATSYMVVSTLPLFKNGK